MMEFRIRWHGYFDVLKTHIVFSRHCDELREYRTVDYVELSGAL
jgi:hypothetical protein